MTSIPDALLTYVIFVFSTTLHEAGHAWAALKGGDPTAYHGGQVSLDPVPHMRREPIGMVVLPLISLAMTGWPFGFASAPYDPYWAMRHPRRAAWMAAAGPAANLLLCLAAVMAIQIGRVTGVFFPPESIGFGEAFGHIAAADSDFASGIGYFVGMVFCLNLVLLLLNLMPVPPLDGSSVILLFMSHETANKYQQAIANPMLAIVGILIAWKVFATIFPPILLFLVDLLWPGVRYG